MKSYAYLWAVGMLGLSACTATTEDTHFLKNVTIAGAGVPGISVDAKQRFVWAPKRLKPGPQDRTGHIICAEPSPDALSQLASAVAVKAQLNVSTGGTEVGAGGQFEKSFSEAVQNIGNRTATIQLLRDGLYRACEAYANDGIDDFGYTLVLTNIDKLMLRLVALETLAANAAPATDVGKKAVADAEAAKIKITQLDKDIAAARRIDEAAKSRVEAALSAANSATSLLVGLKSKKAGLEVALSEDEKNLKAEEDRDPAASDKADKVKALTAAISAKKSQIIDLDANIAATSSAETQAKARHNTANKQATVVAGQLTALLVKLGPAQTNLATTAAAASKVDRVLAVGSAGAILQIATKGNGLGPILAACLAWTAKNDSAKNLKMAGYCDRIMVAIETQIAAAIRLAAR